MVLGLALASCTSSNLDVERPDVLPPATTVAIDPGVSPDQVFVPGTEVDLPLNWPVDLPPPEGSQLWQVLDQSSTRTPQTVSFFLLPGQSVESAADALRSDAEANGLTIRATETANGPDWIVDSTPMATLSFRRTESGTSVVVVVPVPDAATR